MPSLCIRPNAPQAPNGAVPLATQPPAAIDDGQDSPIRYVFNSSFDNPNAWQRIVPVADSIEADWKRTTHGRQAISGIHSDLHSLCRGPLLRGAEQEMLLFRRMNFFKHCAQQLSPAVLRRRPTSAQRRRRRELIFRAQQDRNLLIQANLRLVVSIAKGFAGGVNTFDDVLAEGIDALLRAVENFDYDRGFRFSTYATRAIRRNLYRYVIARRKSLGRETFVGEGGLPDSADPRPDGPAREKQQRAAYKWLMQSIGQLEPREQLIIRARFGLERGQRASSLTDIAAQLGVCKERVRQLQIRALEKLRGLAAEVGFDPTMLETAPA